MAAVLTFGLGRRFFVARKTGAGEMPDPTAADAAQAADADTSQAAASQADTEPFDKERALKTINAQREEVKALKVQAQELATLKAEKAERERTEAEAAEAAAKQRGEFEKLADAEKARATKLEGELTQEREARKADRVRHEVITAAQKLGAANPGVAYRLLDLSQVEYGDDGALKNIDALLEKLFKDEPYLKAEGQAGAGAPKGTPNSPKPAGSASGGDNEAARLGHQQLYRGSL